MVLDGMPVGGNGFHLTVGGLRALDTLEVALRHEFLEMDQLHAPVVVLDNGGHAFDPVAGVEVMDLADALVLRGVDVTADDAVTTLVDGELLKQGLVFINEADGGFHLGLHALAEGKILLPLPRAPAVIPAIDMEEGVVSDRAEGG